LFEELLDRILEANTRIRMVGIFKDLASPVYTKAKAGVEHKLSEEDQNSLRLVFITIVNSLAKLEDELGDLLFTGAFFRDIHFFFFEYNRYTIAVSCDPGPIEPMANQIEAIIEDARQTSLKPDPSLVEPR